MQASTEKSIFDFADYRDFLKARYEAMRASDPKFSFQFCARQLGTTRSYLKLVIDKKRQMGMDKLPGIFKLFRLSPYERECFTFAYLQTIAAGNTELRSYFSNALGALQSGQPFSNTYSTAKPYSTLDRALLNGWMSMALHSAANLVGFQPTVAWVKAHLRGELPPDDEITANLTDLMASGAILRRDDGGYRAAEVDLCRLRPQHKSGWDILRSGAARIARVLEDTASHRPNHFSLRFIEVDEPGLKRFQAAIDAFQKQLTEICASVRNPDRTIAVFDTYHSVGTSQELANQRVRDPAQGAEAGASI